MLDGMTTLNKFIIEEQRRSPGATGEFSALLNDLVTALKSIATSVGKGALESRLGEMPGGHEPGEPRRRLDFVSNEIMARACEWGGHLCGMASEEMGGVYAIPDAYPRGKYLLVFDPLDGSSNLDVNMSVGTIFSVLRRAEGTGAARVADFLQAGAQQVCAGYAIYGPSTMVVLTFGRGVHGFTLEREVGEFVLTHPELRIPEETREFAVNASNERFWDPPVKRYVSECLAGKTGPRGADFNMRWVASFVAEVHRIMVRGGLFMYPADTRASARPARLQLLCKANPMAMIAEAAGGAASTGRERILDIRPTELHQRAPIILGSRYEVERIVRYYREHDLGLDEPYRSPLFGTRSLFMGS